MSRLCDVLPICVIAASCGGTEPTVIELDDGSGFVRRQAVAFDGATYAVAWTTRSGRGAPVDDRLWFARVSPAGELVVAPRAVVDLAMHVDKLALTAAASQYVVWCREQDNSTAPLLAVALDAAGSALGGLRDVGPLYGIETPFATTSTGDRFPVVVQQRDATDTTYLSIRHYAPDLALLGEVAVEPSVNPQIHPAVAWSPPDQATLVAWAELDSVRALRVPPASAPAGPSELVVDVGTTPFVLAAAGDTGALLGWIEPDVRRAQFATRGSGGWLIHPTLVPPNRAQNIGPAIAIRGERAAIAWNSDAETALTQIRVGFLDLDGGTTLDDERELTSGRWAYFAPQIAAGGTEVAVTFTGAVDGGVRLYLALVE